FQSGASITKLKTQGISRLLVTGARINGNSGILAEFAQSKNVVIADSDIAPKTTPSTNSAWLKAPTGIKIADSVCVSALRNVVMNHRFGIVAQTSGSKTRSSAKIKALIEGNHIQYFS